MAKPAAPITEVFYVVTPSGKQINESARTSHDQCRNDFVKDMQPEAVQPYIVDYACSYMWAAYEKAGYNIKYINFSHLTKPENHG